MEDLIMQTLSQWGIASRIVSIQILEQLRHRLEDQNLRELFDDVFFQERLSDFVFHPPDDLPEAQSIIVVATPDPQRLVTFTINGQPVPTIVPPTYLHWQETESLVEQQLQKVLQPHGLLIAPVILPKKLLAVLSGLATYGRNNITYVEGMGSFHRLTAFYSDMPCADHKLHELQMMARCENCVACIRKCPTGAIDPQRFLLHAERCLVFLNEKPGNIPFPTWCQKDWHNCLVGCMHCQTICPENKAFIDWIEEGVSFSDEETDLILSKTPAAQLPSQLMNKLKNADLLDWLDNLPRNLNALIDKG